MPTAAELCVEAEYSALEENARLMGWKLERTSPTSFILGLPASDGSWFWLNCIADKYSAEPPAWHWYNPQTKALDDLKDTPKEAGFFHSNGVICAPWNRLAYKTVDSRGPHDNWDIGNWRKTPENGACRTLSAMALRIARALQANLKGRKAA
jgi:hypothetical protein